MRLSHLPLRLSTGAFLLSSGLSRRSLTAEATDGLAMAGASAPQAGALPPQRLGPLLSASELALGGALLAPFVSPVTAGLGLTAFSAALLRTWWQTPGTHEEGSPRPTAQGLAVSKDVWLLGTGLALVLDGLADGSRRAARRSRARAHELREALPV